MPDQARAIPMRYELPLGSDPVSVRRRIEAMERLLERSFHIPGTKLPVGLDSIIGLVPVAGDFLAAALGLYCVWEARNLGMSKWQLTRMAANIGFDTLVGSVPLAGDVLDFLFLSNTRNIRIIRKHLDKHHPHSKIIEA